MSDAPGAVGTLLGRGLRRAHHGSEPRKIRRAGRCSGGGVGRTEFDRDPATTITPKKVRETVETITQIRANLVDINRVAEGFKKTPSAGGVFGPIIEKLGGLIQQIPLIGGIVGTAPEDVKGIRTDARALASSLLSTITKEDTGRFTDKEREIATEVLGALDVTASPQQIQAALSTVRGIMEASLSRELFKLLSSTNADLSTDEGINSFGAVLLKNGFTNDQASEAIAGLRQKFGFN